MKWIYHILDLKINVVPFMDFNTLKVPITFDAFMGNQDVMSLKGARLNVETTN